MASAIDPLPAPFRFDGEQVGIDLPGARAIFTTRRGGSSTGPYESLNLGRLTDDDPQAVQANLQSLQSTNGVQLTWGRQVHGTDVVVHEPVAGQGGAAPEPSAQPGDGRITTAHGIAPMVLTADCLAVIVAAPGGVAVLHAGWRGLVEGVIAAGVRRLRELGITGEMQAAIGPHARVCCYEVGEEVHERFAAAGHGDSRAGRHLDMSRVATAQLEAAGVSETHDLGLCTICSDPSLFFSHRRDHGVTGRQAGLAWLS